MNLTASLVVRNELGRFLEPCVTSLRSFCDQVVVLDDASDDGTFEWLADQERVMLGATSAPRFFVHEGAIRQALLDQTLGADPGFVLSIDADEFVSDPVALRALLWADPGVPVWSVSLEEVWRADEEHLWIRQDGGWRAHEVSFLWRAPQAGAWPAREWRIPSRKLSTGRVPIAVTRQRSRARTSGVQLLHFGWANEADRVRRQARYLEHDKGRFHARQHLESIMWPDERVTLERREWPAGLAAVKDRILERCAGVAA